MSNTSGSKNDQNKNENKNNESRNSQNRKDDKKKNNPFGDFGKFKGGAGPQDNKVKNVLLMVIIGISLMLVWVVMNEANNPEKEITFTQYQQLLGQNAIYKAVIKKSQTSDYVFHGELKQPMPLVLADKQEHLITFFWTNLGVVDSETEKVWAEKNIEWSYQKDESALVSLLWTVLPWIVLIVIYFVFIKRMQGGAGGGGGSKGIFSFGKSKAKLMNEGESKVTFDDVAGADEAKYELEEVVEFLQTPDKFRKLGGKIPRGLLLVGYPGTGKTLLAKAIAGEAKVPFYSISGADFVEMFVGVGASRVRDLFDTAKKNAPCLVFIDEIDAVGRQRGAGVGGGHDEREQTLNQLLVEMDGFEENNGVIVLAATNRPDVLDPALLRPGRFDRQVIVDKPDIKGREGIFKVHTKKVPLGDDVDLSVLAKATPGLSGADIANIVNESALHAARRDGNRVTMYDFESAMDKVMMGIERKSMVLSDQEKEMTAYHEMGHALVGKFMPESYPVHKVTIIPRGRALGLTSFLPEKDVHSMTKEFLESKIVIDMGGRAAEKLVFNKMNTGAAADLEDATKIAHSMVCDWGMSDALGPVKLAHHQESVFLGREMSQPKDHSEHTAKLIDTEVRRILTDANNLATKILTDNIDKLHKFSKLLVERETLEGEELDMLLNGEELPPINLKTLNAMKSMKLNDTPTEEKSEEISDTKE